MEGRANSANLNKVSGGRRDDVFGKGTQSRHISCCWPSEQHEESVERGGCLLEQLFQWLLGQVQNLQTR